jgi:hypothetical protein
MGFVFETEGGKEVLVLGAQQEVDDEAEPVEGADEEQGGQPDEEAGGEDGKEAERVRRQTVDLHIE